MIGRQLRPGSNSWGGRNPFSWREFDALPRPVRDAINHAAVDLGSRRARMNLKSGLSVREVCAIERAVARACFRRDVIDAFGVDPSTLSVSE